MHGGTRIACAVSVLLALSLSSKAQQRTVVVTFDDLPVAGSLDHVEARTINFAILNSLDRHRVPAIGFVIGKRVQEIGNDPGQALLAEWVRRGYDLGNHTYSHIIFDDLTVEEFEREIVAGEVAILPLLERVGKRPRYFRFPENHTGDTKEKHDAIAAFLTQRGYQLAAARLITKTIISTAPT
jgi:peptidoglycan/xylan/chitin deacetylase (PgdA/CDA1 family)